METRSYLADMENHFPSQRGHNNSRGSAVGDGAKLLSRCKIWTKSMAGILSQQQELRPERNIAYRRRYVASFLRSK